MTKRQQKVEVVSTGDDVFVVVDGVRVARREQQDAVGPVAWISLDLGWEVVNDEKTLNIRYRGVKVH